MRTEATFSVDFVMRKKKSDPHRGYVERCKIPLDELYGFINDFVEHSQCKVILIADEDKLDGLGSSLFS